MKSEQTFEGVGGLNIFMRSRRPEGTLRGVTVLIHGFNAHSGYNDNGRQNSSPRPLLPLTLSTYQKRRV